MVKQVMSLDELPAVISVWPGLGQALGVSRATAYKMIKQEGFPALRVSSKKIIVLKSKLLQYLENQAEVGLHVK